MRSVYASKMRTVLGPDLINVYVYTPLSLSLCFLCLSFLGSFLLLWSVLCFLLSIFRSFCRCVFLFSCSFFFSSPLVLSFVLSSVVSMVCSSRVCTRVYIHIPTHTIRIYGETQTHTYLKFSLLDTCNIRYISAHVHMYMHTHMYIYTCTCTCIGICICICICIDVYMYMYVYI